MYSKDNSYVEMNKLIKIQWKTYLPVDNYSVLVSTCEVESPIRIQKTSVTSSKPSVSGPRLMASMGIIVILFENHIASDL